MSSWLQPGRPRPVVPELLQRLSLHSPELTLIIEHHLGANREALTDRKTFDGVDSSVSLLLVLAEGLIAFEKVRIELDDQIRLSQKDDAHVPAHLLLAMTDLSAIEGTLIQVAKTAFKVHLKAHNAHAGAHRPPYASDPGLGHRAGRWGSPSTPEESDESDQTDESEPDDGE